MTKNSRQYLAQADVSRAIAEVPGNASRALSHPLFDAKLMPASLRTFLPISFALLISPAVRAKYNDDFVVREMAELKSFFDDLGGISLSDQQREACIRLEDSNLLVASAGSGKSATMVGKVGYALRKELYAPEEILVLAFNRKAAEELEERIARQQGVEMDALATRVTTFHALGRGIIEQVEGRPPQLANWIEHPAGEARVVNEIIKHLADTDEEFLDVWVDLLTLQPKADLPPEDFDSEEDYRRYITDKSTKDGGLVGTLSGTFVRSLQEQRIANWLWIHSIDFEYERQLGLPQEDGTVRHVDPDFYYPLTATYHEHFAINADGTSPFENYGQIRTRAIVMQQKTGRSVQFELLPDARTSLLAWLERRGGTVPSPKIRKFEPLAPRCWRGANFGVPGTKPSFPSTCKMAASDGSARSCLDHERRWQRTVWQVPGDKPGVSCLSRPFRE